jgi:hypothetical protein
MVLVAAVLVAAAGFTVVAIQHPRFGGAPLVRETEITIHCGLKTAAVDVDGLWYRFAGPANVWSPQVEDVDQGVDRVPFGWDLNVSVDVYDTEEGLVAVGPLWSSYRLEPINPDNADNRFGGCL